MFLAIAWRNIWAKKRRSVLIVALSAFCTVFLIFFLSFMHGQHDKMLRDAIEIYTGYIQVTGQGYQDHPDYDHLIYDLDQVEKVISGIPDIEHAAPRFQTFALFAAREDSAGGMLAGIIPDEERNISRIHSAVTEGAYLSDTDKPDCLIGRKLAGRLNVHLGDELTYLSQAVDMSTAADILTITGVFSTGSSLDENAVFVSKSYMDENFLTRNIASHYVLLPKEAYRTGRLDHLMARINQKLSGTRSAAVSWKVPLKSMLQLVRVDSVFGYFSYGILIVVIFFVIMIFSLITVFQRTREIGVLRAVGTSPRQIFVMLLAEALILGGIAVVIGAVVGGLLVYHYHVHPIQFNVPKEILEQYQQWGVVDMTFPTVFSYAAILHNSLFVLLLNVLAVLYPAMRVNAYKPVDAINYV